MAVAAALMPDAHVGYGLPIGGVLALENAVIPYAVGVDIACRMKLSRARPAAGYAREASSICTAMRWNAARDSASDRNTKHRKTIP